MVPIRAVVMRMCLTNLIKHTIYYTIESKCRFSIRIDHNTFLLVLRLEKELLECCHAQDLCLEIRDALQMGYFGTLRMLIECHANTMRSYSGVEATSATRCKLMTWIIHG